MTSLFNPCLRVSSLIYRKFPPLRVGKSCSAQSCNDFTLWAINYPNSPSEKQNAFKGDIRRVVCCYTEIINIRNFLQSHFTKLEYPS